MSGTEDEQDSITIGTPSLGGVLKVYGDLTKPEEFAKKIENGGKLLALARATYNKALGAGYK